MPRRQCTAKCEADKFGSPEVGADHILLALLHDPAVVNGALEGISAAEIRDEIKSRITQREQNPLPHDLPLAEDARKVLVLATEEAKKPIKVWFEMNMSFWLWFNVETATPPSCWCKRGFLPTDSEFT